MKYEVTMPSLGADMEKGKFVEWKVKAGDTIKKGQPLAVVETEKAAVEIESFRTGKILELLCKPGEVIPVGSVIAQMEIEGIEKPVAELKPRIQISPAAKQKAQEASLDLSLIKGSGPGGAIELKDIEAIIDRRDESAQAQTGSNINIRDVIARQMAKSKKEIPHYYLKNRIKLDRLMVWLDEQNKKKSPEERLLLPAVLLKATVRALQMNPDLNGFFTDGKFKRSSEIHAGMAVALHPSGVMVPALLDAHSLSLEQMNTKLKDLIERTRSGGLKNREMTEATVTITNVGDLGAHEVFGIIFPPQVAIIGLGKIRKEVITEGESVKPGFVIDVSLSADHRVTDGLSGSKFLMQIEFFLNNPEDIRGAI